MNEKKPPDRDCIATVAALLALSLISGCASSPAVRNSAPTVISADIAPMPKVWLSSAAFWMDNTHLIFSSSDANVDWKLGDLPRIVTFDTISRKLELTPYSGYLYCYSSKRMIVDGGRRANKAVILVGIPGQPLSEVEDHIRPTVTGIDCQSIERDSGGVVTIALKPGDGRLRFVNELANGGADIFTVEFLSEDNRVIAHSAASLDTLPAGVNFVFLPWAGIYAKEGAIGAQKSIAGSLVDPKSGTIVAIDGPQGLTNLANENQGSAGVSITKVGTLWYFRTYQGRPQFQGLYLQTSGGLSRLDDHDVWAHSNVSPDGCRLLYGRVRGDRFAADPFKHRETYELVLLNVCSQGKPSVERASASRLREAQAN